MGKLWAVEVLDKFEKINFKGKREGLRKWREKREREGDEEGEERKEKEFLRKKK